MHLSLLRRLPHYDLQADDNRDPAWVDFVDQIGDGDEVWECRFGSRPNDAIDGPTGLVLLRDGAEIATYPPAPSRRLMN